MYFGTNCAVVLPLFLPHQRLLFPAPIYRETSNQALLFLSIIAFVLHRQPNMFHLSSLCRDWSLYNFTLQHHTSAYLDLLIQAR
ncbi:hypothetical protein BRADI_4g17422v3 [Brachypodium distachyon]|uniref:Uncharacterized protein n=1 Tax=Brachypodium distachyon TaxID=15368 RepID=A0A2K2CNE7_BRADI|nr:hypothetical protein BRADI_4g17422v3 [Brachypodium distachyon]